jgi:enoyl-CoA hydratase
MNAVKLTRHGEAALLTLDRQDALNALSFEIVQALARAFDEVAHSDARVLIVTGAGDKAFCAGADIKELRHGELPRHKRSLHTGQGVMMQLERLPVPSIALVNGYAFGGGLELALACTFRLATPNAQLGVPEIKLGMIPGYGGTQRLPRLIGEARALELVLTGRAVKADEAERIGLVHRVVTGDPLAEALAFAQTFTRYSLPVLAYAREAVQRALDNPLHEGLKVEANLGTLAYGTADAQEGLAAFEAKRKPQFRDA